MSGFGYQGPPLKSLEDYVKQIVQNEREDQWGEMPGKVMAIDYENQTITARPLYKKRLNGEPTQVVDLEAVPVRFQRAGNGGVTFPVQVGDTVTLRPMMRSMDNYQADGGDDFEAYDSRSFSLSDYEAFIDGGESVQDPIPNFDNQNVHVRFDPEGQYGIRGSSEGKIKIEGSEGNIYDLIATFMELVAGDQLQINYGSSSGTGHALENRAELLEIAGKIRAMAL